MGQNARADAPTLATTSFRTRSHLVASLVQQEADFGPDPRVLVALFLKDSPSLLRTVLATLEDGIDVPSIQPTKVRFSIDGSLSSVLFGTFFMGFVVKPVLDRGVPLTGAELSTLTRTLEDAILADLADFVAEGERPCLAEPLRGISSSLFAGLVFTEYRFGLPREVRKKSGKGVRPRLGTALREFAATIADHRQPIAYIYFPDDEDGDHRHDWVRIGVGARSYADWVSVDAAASTIASRHKCELKKYDRLSHETSFGKRFISLVECGPVDDSKYGSLDGAVDVVFSTLTARRGLVSEILGGSSRDAQTSGDLLAGTMTVIAGHTLSCWVLPRGKADRLEARVKAIAAESSDDELLTVRRVPAQEVQPTLGYKVMWVAWKCVDRPGVLSQLVRTLSDDLEGYTTTDDRPAVDYRYSVSRVLADGNSCAGKIKFAVHPELVESFSERASEIRKSLTRVLREPSILKRRSLAAEAGLSLRLSESEPGEEPWASLVLDPNLTLPLE